MGAVATTKIWAVKNRLSQLVSYVTDRNKTEAKEFATTLTNLIDYDADEHKTEKRLYVSGVNCDADNAVELMKSLLSKNDNESDRVAYHAVQSFDGNEIDPATAHLIGVKFAEEMWGSNFPVLVSTHQNTHNCHSHFAICATGFDGKRFHADGENYRRMREVSDRLCREYGLSVIEHPKRGRTRHIGEIKAEEAGKFTARGQMRDDLDFAIDTNISWREWWQTFESLGYTLEYRGKFLRARPDKSTKFFRLDHLGVGYTEEDIQSRLRYRYINALRANFTPFTPPKREKPHGLYTLYLYYCYLLGELPKTIPESREAYDYLKDDIRKMQMYSNEAKLLGKYRIDTTEQLSLFTAGKSAAFKSVAIERKKLRNKLRRMTDTETMQPIKEQISVLSAKLSEIRKEMKLCEDVAERSGAIEAVVNTIFNPREANQIKEQTEKQKEKQKDKGER